VEFIISPPKQLNSLSKLSGGGGTHFLLELNKQKLSVRSFRCCCVVETCRRQCCGICGFAFAEAAASYVGQPQEATKGSCIIQCLQNLWEWLHLTEAQCVASFILVLAASAGETLKQSRDSKRLMKTLECGHREKQSSAPQSRPRKFPFRLRFRDSSNNFI
jgi:hypothetical protein